MQLGLAWEVKLEGKAAPYIQNHPLRLRNRRQEERTVGIQLTLKIGKENKNDADMLMRDGPRADVLMHHLCTSRSLICMHILQTTQRDSCGVGIAHTGKWGI